MRQLQWNFFYNFFSSIAILYIFTFNATLILGCRLLYKNQFAEPLYTLLETGLILIVQGAIIISCER